MDREEFTNYLNANCRAVAIFRTKALAYQHAKNKSRSPAKRWNDRVLASAVDDMVRQFTDNVYDKLKENVKENKLHPRDSWIKFIEGNEVMDSLEDSVAEMEFE